MAQANYAKRLRRATWLAFGAAIPLGVLIAGVAEFGETGGRFWIIFPALLLITGLAFLVSIPWWRRMDDMHRQGHLSSWYWGGLAGSMVALMALIAGAGINSDASKGAFLILFGNLAGFLAAYAIWWWRQRGIAE